MADDLEAKVEQEEIPEFGDFVAAFSERYMAEQSFRNMVHQYMRISGVEVFSLNLRKRFFPNWYKRATGDIINKYAEKIYDDLKLASEIEKEKEQMEKAEIELSAHSNTVEQAEAEEMNLRNDVEGLNYRSGLAKSSIEGLYQQRISEEQRAARQAASEIQVMTDAEAIARQKLGEYVTASPLLKKGDSGMLSFDEKKIEQKLEEIFLEEVLDEVAREESSGFMANLKDSYNGFADYFAELESLSELPNIAWPQSIIYSRTRGYRYPRFPYFITGKAEESLRTGRASIDTAVSLDISGSMDENNRFNVAVKTTLALSALMRRLNEKNRTYLSVFNENLKPVTSIQLLREIRPYDGTSTELALKWLAETLADSKPSIAYLITDGLPNRMNDTINAAKKFRDYPNIMLRIFLIDGDAESEENIRQIGNAAGSTKVIPVKNYQLPTGVIKDLSEVIKGMYAIAA